MTSADQERQNLVRLRDFLNQYFNLEELRLLCFDLGIDYEDLAGTTKSTKTQNLITYMQRRGALQQLLTIVKKQRPHVNWPDLSSSTTKDPTEEKHRSEPFPGDQVGGDKISTGDINDVSGAGIGERAQGLSAGDVGGGIYQAQGDITIGKDLRDEQYEIALNWDGQRRMRGYDLAGRDLSDLNLAQSDLRKADLQGADLNGTDLSDADLSGAKLRGAKLAKSDLSRAILKGTDLEDANLWHASLIEVQLLDRPILLHANLTDANLFKATIFAGNLHGANLKGADLREAKVIADMRNADLSAAKLQGTDLSSVDTLWQVISFEGAKYDKHTKWPDGFDPKAHGAILVDAETNAKEEKSEEAAIFNSSLDEKTGLELIRIPAGDFIYGKENRLAFLPDYWISKTPVTNAQYFRFVRDTGHNPPDHWKGTAPKAGIANHPAIYINWDDAKAYAEWAGMHLPTEEEWEKAARGTDGRIYPWGNKWHDGYCNTEESEIGFTTPVGHYSPRGNSPYGCVDMVGNIWEWTSSWYDEEEKLRVVRGAAWFSDLKLARAESRGYVHPTDRDSGSGFRVIVRQPPSQ